MLLKNLKKTQFHEYMIAFLERISTYFTFYLFIMLHDRETLSKNIFQNVTSHTTRTVKVFINHMFADAHWQICI